MEVTAIRRFGSDDDDDASNNNNNLPDIIAGPPIGGALSWRWQQ